MMPPIVFTLLQGLFLLLLYIFVARAVRAVIRDVSAAPTSNPAPSAPRRASRSAQPAGKPGRKSRDDSGHKQERPKRIAPRELVVHSPDGRPRVLPLDGSEITFGRGEHVSVALGDPYTSDQHARVYNDGRRWLVADLGSTNGTFVNQVKVTAPTPIAAGDQLGIGRTVVEVRK